jgi:hypothetical protein
MIIELPMFSWSGSEWRICNAIANKISRLRILTEAKSIVNAETITTEAAVDLIKGGPAAASTGTAIIANGS